MTILSLENEPRATAIDTSIEFYTPRSSKLENLQPWFKANEFETTIWDHSVQNILMGDATHVKLKPQLLRFVGETFVTCNKLLCVDALVSKVKRPKAVTKA